MRLLKILFFMLMFLSFGDVLAQTPLAIVSLPIHGKLAVQGGLVGRNMSQLLLVDTVTGQTEIIAENENIFDDPMWQPNGNLLAFRTLSIIHIYDSALDTTSSLPIQANHIPSIQDWSGDGTQLLSVGYDFTDPSAAIYRLQIIDLSGTVTTLFSYPHDTLVTDIPLPVGISSFSLFNMMRAEWNPVYPEWIIVQLGGYDYNTINPDSGYPVGLTINYFYNRVTGEKILLNSLFDEIISYNSIRWSPDGEYLTLRLDVSLSRQEIVRFQNLNGTWSAQVVDGTISDRQVVMGWLGISDLLLTAIGDTATGDSVLSISQVINGTWHTREFVRFPVGVFEYAYDKAWLNQATQEEQYQLSCLFDQALPIRIAVGDRARVNFTDGTPLRLRTQPDFDAPEVTQMAEGTEFDIIGDSACVNASDYYRFWQVQLDDGTTGWAAEASTTDYFIEPVQ